MKFLHTSDWHLGKHLYDFSLQEDQEHWIAQLLALLAREKVDAVLLAGDIFDRPVPPVWALQLYDHFLSRTVQKMGIPVLAVAGNHDSGARLEFGSSLYRSEGYYIAGHLGADHCAVTLPDASGPIQVTLLPYLYPADVRSLYPESGAATFDQAYRAYLERNPPRPGLRSIAVAHGFFSNLQQGDAHRALLTSDSEINIGGIDLAGSDCFAQFDYAALGHLHAPQWVERGRVRYSGSPLAYSLSEAEQVKSVGVVSLHAGSAPQFEEFPLRPLRNVRTVRGPFDELLEPGSYQNKHFDDYVFAEIEGQEVPYPMEKLRTLFPHLLGLRFSSLGQQMPELHRMDCKTPRLSAEELFCRFYREIRQENIPESQLALLREILKEQENEVDL